MRLEVILWVWRVDVVVEGFVFDADGIGGFAHAVDGFPAGCEEDVDFFGFVRGFFLFRAFVLTFYRDFDGGVFLFRDFDGG